MQTRAFPEAYRRLLPPLRGKCRRMLGSSALAEDVVQETFARLWRSGPPIADSDTPTLMRWLYRTSTRLAIDVLRDQRRTRASGAEDVDATLGALPCAASPHDVIAARAAIAELCVQVPEDEIEAALLARVDGLSQVEVASVLGISERSVRRLLHRFDERTAELRREGWS